MTSEEAFKFFSKNGNISADYKWLMKNRPTEEQLDLAVYKCKLHQPVKLVEEAKSKILNYWDNTLKNEMP